MSTGATGSTGFAGTVLAAGARDSQGTNSLSLVLLESHDLLIIGYAVLFFSYNKLDNSYKLCDTKFPVILRHTWLKRRDWAIGITEDFLDLNAATGAAGSLETN